MTADEAHNGCEQVRPLLEAYALGGLTTDERTVVQTHLERCLTCRRLASELADAAHALPSAIAAASPLAPPLELRERVLASVEPSQRRFEWWPRAALAFAALLFAGLLAAWEVRLDDALSKERDLRAMLARVRGQQAVVLEIVDSPKTVKTVMLPPPGSSSTAYGKVFTRPDHREVVAMANRLPEPPPGRVYRLWLTSGGRTRLAGTLARDRRGFALLVFEAARRGPRYEGAQVLLQPKASRLPRGVRALVGPADR